jgi:hypothetical protein
MTSTAKDVLTDALSKNPTAAIAVSIDEQGGLSVNWSTMELPALCFMQAALNSALAANLNRKFYVAAPEASAMLPVAPPSTDKAPAKAKRKSK